MLLYEVIIKSRILSKKFIKKKIREVLAYNLPSKILYAISTKPIGIALNVKQTIIYFFHCMFSLWPDSPEKFKL